jgi:hypothetical protein
MPAWTWTDWLGNETDIINDSILCHSVSDDSNHVFVFGLWYIYKINIASQEIVSKKKIWDIFTPGLNVDDPVPIAYARYLPNSSKWLVMLLDTYNLPDANGRLGAG